MPPEPRTPTRFTQRLRLGSALLACLLAGCSGDLSPEEHLQRAREHQAAGELRAAWIETRNVLLGEPDNAEARALMGELQFTVGAMAEAEKEFRRAIDLGLPRARFELSLVRSLLLQGRNDEVLDRTAEGELPDLPPADLANLLGLRAQALYSVSELDAASAAATAALDLDPTASEAVLARAMMQVRDNEVDAAAAALDANLAIHPGFASGWHLRGDIHRVRGEVDGAIAAYGKAVELRPFGLADRVKHALALVAKGDESSREASLAEAKELARRAPKYPGADYIRGLVALQRGETTAARDALLAALAKSPEYSPAKLYLAQAHVLLGERQQAESLLAAVVKEMPQASDARHMLGALRLQRGDFSGVVEVLEPLVAARSADSQSIKILATAYFGLDRGREAVALFERAASLAPESASTKAQLGLALLAGGDSIRGVEALEAAIEGVPEDPQTRAQLVTSMLRAGDLDRALSTAEHFLEATPDSAVSLKLLAVVQMARGEKDAAAATFERALAGDPADPSANHALAQLAIERKDYPAARARYEAVLAVLPEHERTLLALTELDSREGRLEDARRRLEAMIAHTPKSLEPRLMLAQYHLGTGEPQAAQRTLAEVRDGGLNNSSWLLLMASASLDGGQAVEAVGYLERLVQRNPGSADFAYRLAQAYAAAGKPGEASGALEQALRLAPDHLPSLVARLRGLELGGRHDEAMALLSELQQRFPEEPEVKAQVGWLASRAADTATAVGNLEAAYATQPTAALARDIAAARAQSGDNDGAVAVLREWLARDPADTVTRSVLGLSLMSLGRRDEGLETLREVVKASPDDPLALNNLAWFLVESDPTEALKLAERAYAAARDNPAIIDTLARTRTANQDHRGAERLLRDALTVTPDRIELRLSLANTLEAAGDAKAARMELEAVLERDPDNSTAKALLERMGS